MTELFAAISGHRLTALHVCVPNVGAWFVDCDLDSQVELSGRVEITIGTLSLKGTVVPRLSGSFGLATKVRVIAGGAGWAKSVAPKHYHNEAGVKALTVLSDAARSVGETIAGTPPQDRVGIDFVRRSGPASRVLEQVLGSSPWYVDYAGVTRVGAQVEREVSGTYELLSYDPRAQLVTLAVDDPVTIGVGSVLRTRLDSPVTVRELEFELTAGKFRVSAWVGGDALSAARAVRASRVLADGN